MTKFVATNKFTVLRHLTENDIFYNFLDLGNENDYYKLISLIIDAGAENNFCKWLSELILYDVNAFSKTCAQGIAPSDFLINSMIADLEIIYNAIKNLNTHNAFAIGEFSHPFVFSDAEKTVENLREFYKINGYGDFIRYFAFNYNDGKFIPIKKTSPVTLSDLKGYAVEKSLIINNVSDLISGYPHSHMLLYGDKGTGKSSTVHAILNEFKNRGLRIVQIDKEKLYTLGSLYQELGDIPLKFILFIDDLSLSENDDKISSLKASLEGTIAETPKNVMIVATSNRRHIIKESFSDRDNSVHLSDSLNEQLSLSDRFGITVLFSSTDKTQYLNIIKQLAKDFGISCDENLLRQAEKWAILKGERSPRRAKQFIDLAYSCNRNGREINF